MASPSTSRGWTTCRAGSMEQRQKGEQFRILDPAVPAREPLARRTRLILTSLMISLGLAAVGVVLAEQADTSFHNMDDLRRFSIVPVLASIPRIVCESDVTRQKRRFRIAAAATALGLLMLVVITYFVATGNEQLGSLLSQGRM